MPENTDLNTSPYFDDYDSTKNYHKVLYRASRPLQARELTQSQSILQNQVERFGGHFFKEGAIVEGAQADIDMDIYYVKVDANNPNTSGTSTIESYREDFHGKLLRGKTSGVVGKVIFSAAETSSDDPTLFIKYQVQGTDTKNSYQFLSGEDLEEVGIDSNGNVAAVSNNNEFQVEPESDEPQGRASIANISEGVIFTRGFFVRVEQQKIIIEKYSGRPSARIGLTINESLISSANDSSLLDNASGTSNENAPGGDRLKIGLTFAKKSLTDTTDENFIELLRVNQGILELQVLETQYNTIENTLARRTFDANGDFVVRQFLPTIKEHLDDGSNNGVYGSTFGGLESKFVLSVSPGKAYVKGFEIDKIGTSPITLDKARTTKSLTGANTPVRLGNFIKVKNTHSVPEFGNETGSDTQSPFQVAKLYDAVIASAGSENSSGHIGFCRIRNVDLDEGTDTSGVYDDTSKFNVYLFDIKMFTKISYSAHSGTAIVGDRVTGSVSGAVGIVAYDNNSDALFVHDVIGEFTSSDAISSENGSFAMTDSQNTAVRNYNIDRARGISQEPNESTRETFTADLHLDSDKILLGSVTISGTSVTGFGTNFTTELKEGDVIIDGGGAEKIIASVTDATTATLTTSATAISNANVTRRRAKVNEQDKTASIYAWPRDYVKEHTPDQLTVRRQTVVTIASQSVSISTGANETFDTVNTDNFMIGVIEEASGSPTLNNGDVLNIEDFTTNVTSSGSGQSIAISGFDAADDGAILKITFTVDINSPVNRDKTLRKSRVLKVGNSRSTGGFYGTCYDDRDISLGVADVFKVRAIYESNGVADALPPSAVITETGSASFQNFETITNGAGDKAVFVNYGGTGNTSHFYYTGTGTFSNGDTITGETSSATGTLATVTTGSKNITGRYFFDDGQRDGYYDLSKLTLKQGEPSPSNSILIVFDYFTVSGAGDFFDVNSYSDVDYKDIPKYIPNRIDLGGLEPDGQFELSDAVDFRPVVGQILGTTTFSSGTPDPTSPIDLSNSSSGAVSSPFAYTSRSFKSAVSGITATGANATDVPVNGTNVVGDIDFYVGRIDKIFLHKEGSFEVSVGTPALSPTKPKAIDEAIQMFEVHVPAFTNNLKEVIVKSFDHRRFTMKDIGKINNRVANLERLTSLSLLERDTSTLQVLDADGFDRFKSGFVVDSFKGHDTGDVAHPDYRVSMDAKLGAMRPENYQNFFDITLDTVNSSSYQKTGDLLTLPYSQISYVNQNLASRAINVNPYNVFAFIGTCKLSPETDIWQDQTRLPEVRINREGNFNAVLNDNRNSLGSVWNSWQTSWVGEPRVTDTEVTASSQGSWSGDPAQDGEWVNGIEVSREITETPETQTRTGIRTTVVEDFVEDRRDRVVSINIIPFIRARTIEIDAQNLKPNSYHYVYFDNIDVNEFVRPFSVTYSQDGGTTVSSGIKADGNGRVRAFFELPNTDKRRFSTGQRELKVTSSVFNQSNPSSVAAAMYQAQGLLQSNQTEIVSTRNGRVITEQLNDSRQFTRRGERVNARSIDTNAPERPEPQNESPPELPPITSIERDDEDDITVDEIVFTPIAIPTVPLPPPPPEVPVRLPFDFGIRDIFDFERGWRDPLAQSFMVEANGGMFMTSIDLYFKTKDNSLPVSVEIRNMVNGYPGQVVLPFSVVTKNPADVNLSQDGSVATTFTFDSPVYLEHMVEYCFVVLSNSNEYETFISKMGEKDLITSETISGQPYAGSLFKSQNASTWSAEQTEDLKFNMKIARFDTSKTADIRFNNAAIDAAELQNNPIETTSGSRDVKVYAFNHGHYDTSSNVTITGVTGDKTGAVFTVDNGTLDSGTLPSAGTYTGIATTTSGSGTGCEVDITVVNTGVLEISSIVISQVGSGYDAADSLTVTNFSGTQTVTIQIDSVGDTLGGLPVDAINQTFTAVSDIKIDTFKVALDLSSYDFASSLNADDSTVGGGNSATSTVNYYFDSLHTIVPSFGAKGTSISANIKSTAMKSPEGYINGTAYQKRTTSSFITLNDNNFFDAPSVVASTINENNEMSNEKSFTLQTQLQTVNPNLSPVIDVGSIGCLGIANRINGLNSSSVATITPTNNPDGELNTMTYVTKKVMLKTPATSIKVLADIFRPSTTDIKVMFKILKNDESTPFDDLGFEFFNSDGSPDTTVDNDARNFKEYEYTAEGLAEFSAFAIKIVGQAHNTSVVPLVSNFRAIALAT